MLLFRFQNLYLQSHFECEDLVNESAVRAVDGRGGLLVAAAALGLVALRSGLSHRLIVATSRLLHTGAATRARAVLGVLAGLSCKGMLFEALA